MLSAPNVFWVAFGVGAGFACALVLWQYERQRRRDPSRVLRRAGAAILRDAAVPDPVAGLVYVDYLLLTAEGIQVVDLKDFPGVLFGGEQTDSWTQLLNGHSYRFPNPLYENSARAAAVRALVKEVPVQGKVVFTASGRFPKGVPQGVVLLDELSKWARAHQAGAPVPEHYRQEWNALVQLVQKR